MHIVLMVFPNSFDRWEWCLVDILCYTKANHSSLHWANACCIEREHLDWFVFYSLLCLPLFVNGQIPHWFHGELGSVCDPVELILSCLSLTDIIYDSTWENTHDKWPSNSIFQSLWKADTSCLVGSILTWSLITE